MTTETSLAQTIVKTMREITTTPNPSRPSYVLVNTKDLEAVIEEHLDEYLSRDRDETPPPSTHLLGLSDAQVEAVLHLVESRLCIVWSKIGAREEFANQLRVLELAPEDPVEICEACGEPFEDGDLVYWIADDTGHIHADCCGPERDSYVGPDGAPLKDGDPIPEPFAYRDPRTTTEGKDNG